MQKTYTLPSGNGEKVEEDLDISVKGNFVQYHVNDDDTEVWVVDDFNAVSCYNISVRIQVVAICLTPQHTSRREGPSRRHDAPATHGA